MRFFRTLALAACLLLPAAAAAQRAKAVPTPSGKTPADKIAERRLAWKPEWARIGVFDVALAASAVTVGYVANTQPIKVTTRRSGAILFDEPVREALGGDDPDNPLRPLAKSFSDIGMWSLMAAPYVIDAGILALARHRSPDVALQMAMINAEAAAVVYGLHGVTTLAIARERPYGLECGRGLEHGSEECRDPRRFRSFFSQHAANSFNGAGLICSHHLQLRLFGLGPADAIACATALTAASAVAVFRVVGDRHWASDVIMGAAVGSLVGFGIPLLHYHGGIPTLELAKRGGNGMQVSLVPSPNGLGLSGIW